MKFIISLIILVFLSCQSKSTCKLSAPTALFHKSMDQVKNQEFEIQGMNSTETIDFNSGTQLELFQSGCESIIQEFRFTLPKSGTANKSLVDLIAIQFDQLGLVNPKLFEMTTAWSGAIRAHKTNIKPGEKFELGAGFFLKIDQIESGTNVIVSAIFSEH